LDETKNSIYNFMTEDDLTDQFSPRSIQSVPLSQSNTNLFSINTNNEKLKLNLMDTKDLKLQVSNLDRSLLSSNQRSGNRSDK